MGGGAGGMVVLSGRIGPQTQPVTIDVTSMHVSKKNRHLCHIWCPVSEGRVHVLPVYGAVFGNSMFVCRLHTPELHTVTAVKMRESFCYNTISQSPSLIFLGKNKEVLEVKAGRGETLI